MTMMIKNGQLLINDELIYSDIYIEEGNNKGNWVSWILFTLMK